MVPASIDRYPAAAPLRAPFAPSNSDRTLLPPFPPGLLAKEPNPSCSRSALPARCDPPSPSSFYKGVCIPVPPMSPSLSLAAVIPSPPIGGNRSSSLSFFFMRCFNPAVTATSLSSKYYCLSSLSNAFIKSMMVFIFELSSCVQS